MGWGELKAAFPGKLSQREGGSRGGREGQVLANTGGCRLPVCVPWEGAALSKGPPPCLNHKTLFLPSWLQTCRHSCLPLAVGRLAPACSTDHSWASRLLVCLMGHRCPQMIQP